MALSGLLATASLLALAGPAARTVHVGDETLNQAVVGTSVAVIKTRDGEPVLVPVAAVAATVVLMAMALTVACTGLASSGDARRRWRARLVGAPPAVRRAN